MAPFTGDDGRSFSDGEQSDSKGKASDSFDTGSFHAPFPNILPRGPGVLPERAAEDALAYIEANCSDGVVRSK